MNEIMESLGKIGLSDKEAKVYVTLLGLGEATVGDIATESALKRPTTYVILDQLRQKGLVLKIPNAKKTLYVAKSPEELQSYVSENMRQFNNAFPKLQTLASQRRPVKTLYFEGIAGMKEALYYRLPEVKSVTGFWAKADKAQPKIMDLFLKIDHVYQKNKVMISGITPNHSSIQTFVEQFPDITQDLKLVPVEDYSSDISIEIVNDFIRILDPIELKAVIIENDRVAETMRQIFKLVKKNYEK